MSLVELLVVIALLGVMAAFAIPSMGRVAKRAKGKAYAREVATVLRQARNQAMSSGDVMVARVLANPNNQMIVYRTAVRATGLRARTCSEVDTGADLVPANILLARNLDDVSDVHRIDGGATAPTANLTQGICFMPDGRVLDVTGQPLSPGLAGTNCGDVVLSALIVTHWEGGEAITPSTLNSCESTRDLQLQRDVHDVYWVQVHYNGTIEVSQ